jgi:uncharacterized membrane protein YgcG
MAARSPIADLHSIRHRRIRRSAAIGILPALLVTGWLLFWAAPAGAWSAVVPTITSASVSVEPATSQTAHDECATGVSASSCETVLTVIHVHVQLPAGGGEDCQGPTHVGYASEINSEGRLKNYWLGDNQGQNCGSMEGCPEHAACELTWTAEPFAYGGKVDCTHRSFAVEVSLEYLGNGEGYSKAYPVTIEPPKGCKEEGGGTSGTGTSGTGTGSSGRGGGGESGSDCLATASCVVPFLRPPQVLHGTAVLLHADGTSERLRDAHGVQGGDTIKTGSKSAARIRFDNDDDLTLGPNTSVKVVSRGSILSSVLCGVGCSVLVPAISVAGEVIWRISGGAPPLLLGGFNPYAETWPDFAGYTTAPILHEGLPSGAPGGRASDVGQLAQARNASAGAVFTLETTPSAMRVSVYAGAVRLRNIRGKRKQTVNVKAGFQSLVNGTRVPSKPRRFKPPTQPFWK